MNVLGRGSRKSALPRKGRRKVSIDTKANVSERGTWIRLLYMILFAMIFSVAELVLTVIVVVQFLFKLLRGNEIQRLSKFGTDLGEYFRAIILFLSYGTEDMPYPFGEWPTVKVSGEGSGEAGTDKGTAAKTAAGRTKRTRKRTPRRGAEGRAAGSTTT